MNKGCRLLRVSTSVRAGPANTSSVLCGRTCLAAGRLSNGRPPYSFEVFIAFLTAHIVSPSPSPVATRALFRERFLARRERSCCCCVLAARRDEMMARVCACRVERPGLRACAWAMRPYP